MIIEAKKGELALDLSKVESCEQIDDLNVMLYMDSGKTHKVKFNYAAFIGIWKQHQDEEMKVLKNIDRNTFAPRI